VNGTTAKGGPDNAEWWTGLYHEAEADIRWAKERSVNIVQLFIALQAGIVAFGRDVSDPVARGLIAVAVVAALAAWVWLWSLNRFAKGAREWVHVSFGEHLPTGVVMYPIKRTGDPHHVAYLVMHWLAVAIALAVSVVVVWP
jgi:hypothetical protein